MRPGHGSTQDPAQRTKAASSIHMSFMRSKIVRVARGVLPSDWVQDSRSEASQGVKRYMPTVGALMA